MHDGLKVVGKALSKISDARVIEIMPGISSVATKVMSNEIKTNSKIKIEFVNIWITTIINKYLMSLPSQTQNPTQLILLDLNHLRHQQDPLTI